MRKKNIVPIIVMTGFAMLTACSSQKAGRSAIKNSAGEVWDMISKVNDHWQKQNPQPGRAFWDLAAYHTGNMEAYFLTHNENYRKYSEEWAEYNQWMGAKSNNKANWKYSYGETDDYVLFGDWQICFQTYADLYTIRKEERKIKRAIEVMEYQMSTVKNDYWWWADGLYMVMPVMTKLYRITGNRSYLDKLYDYFRYADSMMFDKEEKLYYRDARYIFPKHKTASGRKDFWARGNGWVFAGLAKVLADLPEDYSHRAVFVSRFHDMAESLQKNQQPGGYWTRSLLDTAQAPGYETSGTAFFSYGLFWGINNGYLKKKEYLPAALRSWNYLATTALQQDGRIGYVQPIGERAVPGQIVDQHSTAGFGVGAFLLAACELHRFITKNKS